MLTQWELLSSNSPFKVSLAVVLLCSVLSYRDLRGMPSIMMTSASAKLGPQAMVVSTISISTTSSSPTRLQVSCKAFTRCDEQIGSLHNVTRWVHVTLQRQARNGHQIFTSTNVKL